MLRCGEFQEQLFSDKKKQKTFAAWRKWPDAT
jgi:hypothetical protein